MSLLLPKCSLPAVDSEGGHAWFSCLKNSSRFPSLVWQPMYNHEKSSTSHLRELSCCLPFDGLGAVVLKSDSLLR